MTVALEPLGLLLAEAVNRITATVLAADPDAAAQLNNLAGQSIELRCTLPPSIWHLRIEPSALTVHPGPTAAPQTIVSGSLPDMTRWLAGDRADPLLEIEGDAALVLALSQVLRSVQWDPSAPFRSLVGPDLANTFAGGGEIGWRTLQGLARDWFTDAASGLHQLGGHAFVQRDALAALLDRAGQLRLRIDRLEARIQLQEARRAQ